MTAIRLLAVMGLPLLLMPLCLGCQPRGPKRVTTTFDDDLAFLRKHTDVLVLGANPDRGPRVAVLPAYQGRVMTSTTGGKQAPGFGWINRTRIAAGDFIPHVNAFGGEDRFWLGPEGGQYSIFFKQGEPFDLAHWQAPAVIDTVPYEITARSADEISFRHEATLLNYAGTELHFGVERTVRLLDARRSAELLGLEQLPKVDVVAFESLNRLTNLGNAPWTRADGTLSIWILGMFNHWEHTTVVIPYRRGAVADLGPIVNDDYFGKLPPERLRYEDGMIYYKGDGHYRSKIGVSPLRAREVLGSYDPAARVLTLAQFNQPAGATEYINSMWKVQDQPFAGDVVNSYNDGPAAPGAEQLGPFYELETSSPAAFLEPGESLEHVHRTFHFLGDPKQLDVIARRVLGVSTAEIATALP